MDQKPIRVLSPSLSRSPVVALVVAAMMVMSGALAGAVSATASSEQAYWTTVTQVKGKAMESMRARAAAMRSGNVPIVAGQFKGEATFPTGPSTSVTLTDDSETMFVAAMESGGKYFDWITQVTGTSNNGPWATSAAVSADDTIYVGGWIYGTTYFPTGRAAPDDSIALTPADTNYQSGFVAAIAPGSRYFAWAQLVGKTGGSSSSVTSLSVAPDGAPVVTGVSSGTAYFPTDPNSSITLSGVNLFVAAMNRDDSYFEWVRPIPNASGSTFTAVSEDDTTLVTGTFSRSLTLPTGPSSSVTLTTDDTLDTFVAAMSADDSYFAWAQRAGDDSVVGSAFTLVKSIAVTREGTPVISGRFQGTAYFPTGRSAPDDSIAVRSVGDYDVFVAAMNADDSYFAWAQRAGGSGFDEGAAITVTPSGEPVVTGTFNGTAYFPAGVGDDSVALTSAGSGDVFVAAMSSHDSYFTWAQRAGGTGSDTVTAIATASRGNPFVFGTIAGTASFPMSASESLDLTAVGTRDLFAGFLSVAMAPNPPAPASPSSEPRDVVAVAGDGSVDVSWSTPASTGSYPVTNYQVVSAPGGRTCLVSAPGLACTVTGLMNGTAYTFTVKALNGAGWSAASDPSNAVTPTTAPRPSITIIGTRDGQRIEVTGTTTDFGMGAILNPWVKLAGQSAYSRGTAEVLVSMDGTFEWGRTTGKKASVYMQTPDGSVKSNTVSIRAR